MRRATACVVAAAALTIITHHAGAQNNCDLVPMQLLSPSGGMDGDRFGHALAMDGECMVVGAYRDDDVCSSGSNCNSGSVHVFMRGLNAWTFMEEVKPPDLASGDNFGRAVAMSGHTMIVGSPLDDDAGSSSGSAYIYVLSGGAWVMQAKLRASDQAAGDSFGDAVALLGDTAVVGALLDDHVGGLNAGSIYIFQRTGTTWTQTAKLTADDAAANDNFGNTIAMHGDTIIVGAENDDDPAFGLNAGSAYVFFNTGGTWSQQAKLKATAGARDDHFGWEVALEGDTAAVTASDENDRGAVYIFQRTGTNWDFLQRLESSDIGTFDDFGFSIAMWGDRMVIGASGDDDACTPASLTCDSGAAYLFERVNGVWHETQKFRPADNSAEDEFGYAVAMTDTSILVGARMHDGPAPDAGAAYLFDITCIEPCMGDLNFDGTVNLSDVALIFSAWAGGIITGADLNGDGFVNVLDLFVLLSHWGPCDDSRSMPDEPANNGKAAPPGQALSKTK